MTAAPRSFADKAIGILQVWGAPFGMTIAYLILMWSADTDTTGKAWMAIGLGFVFVIWFVFRLLTTNAAIARALAIGDSARILAVSDRFLTKHRNPAARAPYLVARAFAYELRGEWPAVLAALDEAKLDAIPAKARATWQLRAASSRIAALVATGKLAEARTVLERDLQPDANHVLHSDAYLAANLAAGRVLAAEGKRAEATARLAKVRDDIRASAAMRAAVESALAAA
jgi:hypothetical protein